MTIKQYIEQQESMISGHHQVNAGQGGSFKSFLNYSKLTSEKLLSQDCFVIEIDLDTNSITQTPIHDWFNLNMNKGEM